MDSKKTSKKKSSAVHTTKKEYVDRSRAEELEFPEFSIYSSNPNTVLLLLGADENEIVLRALHHLDKFAKKSPENVQKLYELKMMDHIMNHKLFEHNDLFIKRFSLKLIAVIFHNTEAKFEEEATHKILTLVRNYYCEDKDNFIIEYSALSLLKLASEPRLSAALIDDLELISEGIYKHISSTADPDILYNSYKLLFQIFTEGISSENICAIKNAPFERILSDFRNEFSEIRKSALDIMAEFALCKNEFFVSRFCCRTFFEDWFKIIEDEESIDCHLTALLLCRRLLRHSLIARLFFLQYLTRFHVFWTNTALIQEGIEICYELSMYPESWQYLFATGIVNQLRDHLSDTENATYELCVALAKLMNHPESFLTIMQPDTVSNLLNIIKTPTTDWTTRGAAAEALNILCKRNLEACETSIAHNVSSVLSQFLKAKFGEIPSEVYINVLNLLNSLAKNEEIKEKVMTIDLAQALIFASKNSARSTALVTNLFNTLSVFSDNRELRDELLANEFWITSLKYLRSPAIALKNAVAEFVMHTAKYREFTDYYIDDGILELLLNDEPSLISCSNWSSAIESILAADLSVKFTIRGKLDFNDITNRNFYISKYNWNDLSAFRNMINEEVSPRHTLFLVNYDHRECSEGDIVHVPKFTLCADGITLLSVEDCTYCRRPNDPYLPKYLEKARNLLESHGLCDDQTKPSTIDIGKIPSRAKILASVVTDEMCGVYPEKQNEKYAEEAVTQHLNQLKYILNCNIIPLGQIRYAGTFERAILFKTLADKTGLPCTLQRSEDGKTLWNEIPVPTADESIQDGICSSSTVLPKRLLRPTHLVDLMDHPGELYPLNSHKAYEYLRLL